MLHCDSRRILVMVSGSKLETRIATDLVEAVSFSVGLEVLVVVSKGESEEMLSAVSLRVVVVGGGDGADVVVVVGAVVAFVSSPNGSSKTGCVGFDLEDCVVSLLLVALVVVENVGTVDLFCFLLLLGVVAGIAIGAGDMTSSPTLTVLAPSLRVGVFILPKSLAPKSNAGLFSLAGVAVVSCSIIMDKGSNSTSCFSLRAS